MKSVVASIVMGILIFWIDPNGILNIIVTVIISTLVYFVVLLILKGINREEFEFIRQLLNSGGN